MTTIETSNFKRLIGAWTPEGTISTGTETLLLTDTDSYELILEGNFILYKADVKMGNEKSETIEMIIPGSSAEKGKMHYYNATDERGQMTSSLMDHNFTIKAAKLKFEGMINDENTRLTGIWYRQADNGRRTEFINLKRSK